MSQKSHLDNNISLNVYLDGSSVGKKGFGLPLLVTRFRDTVDALTGVDTGAKTFTVAGDRSAEAVVGRTLFLERSTGNDGRYTVVSATYTALTLSTAIVVTEAVADATVDGRIVFTCMDYALSVADIATKTFTFNGIQGLASQWEAGDKILLYGGNANDGIYTIVTATKVGQDLVVVVAETPASDTALGGGLLAYDGARAQLYADGVGIDGDKAKMGVYTAAHLAVGLQQKPHSKYVLLGFWGLMEDDPATAATAISLENDDWYGMAMDSRLPAHIAATAPDSTSMSAYLAGKEKIGVAQTDESELLDTPYDDTATAPDNDVASVMKNLNRFNAHMNYHQYDKEFEDWALLCNRLGVDPDVSATIWTFVTLEGVTPDTTITPTQGANMDGKNCNYYNTFGGVGSTGKGFTPKGDKIDLVITAHWVAARLREAYAAVLLNATNSGSKIPYTDVGFQAFRGETEKILQQGVAAGHFAAGTTGIVIPALKDVPDADRTARLLRITAGAQPAGAVESVAGDVYISINFAIQV